MRNDDNNCKCLFSSYNNALSDKTPTYFFLIIPRAKASHNIVNILYTFEGYIESIDLTEKMGKNPFFLQLL